MREPPPRDAGRGRDRQAPAGQSAPAEPAGFRDIGMYGLCVRSTVDLSGWPEPPQLEPQVLIREDRSLPRPSEGAPFTGRSTFTEDEVGVEVRGVARFLASGGSCIRFAPDPAARPEDVRVYLTGAMFGVVLHQRGIVPLHASSVAVDGTGGAFAGASGSGKSTLVAALLERGARFVSDDICAFTPLVDGESRVWPGARRMKLDDAGLAVFDRRGSELEPAGGERGKYHVPVSAGTVGATAVPLSRVYLLAFGEGAARLEPLAGLEAISALVDETYLLSFAAALGLTSQIFRKVAALSRTLTVKRLIRPRGFEHVEAVLDLIERDVRGVHGKPAHARTA